MAATVDTRYYYGAAPPSIESNVSNLRFKTNDNNVQDTADALLVPQAGQTHYSYWKQIALYATVGPSNSLNNLVIYSDGAIGWTGCTLKAAEVTNYDRATGTQSETGHNAEIAVDGHTDLTGGSSMADIASYTAAAPLSLAGSLGPGATGKINTGYVCLQVTLTDSAAPGSLSSEVLTWRYDET